MSYNLALGAFVLSLLGFTNFMSYNAGGAVGFDKGRIFAADLIMERQAKNNVVVVEKEDKTYYFSDCWISGESNQGILTFYDR